MKLHIKIDDKTYEVEVEPAEPETPAAPHNLGGLNIGSAPLRVPAGPAPIAPPAESKPENEEKVCRSPVSGIVVRVAAQVGQSLQPGDILLVLEAMKMETNITTPSAGKIAVDSRESGRQRTGRPGGSGVRVMSAELEQVPGFLFFDHVAISVKPGELEAHVKAYQTMGFEEVHREDVLGGDQVREVLLQVGDGPNLVQLLEPLTPESPVAKQIEKNGGRGGLAHVALRVADIQKAFDHLKEHGFKIIDKAPRKGSRGTTVFFVHPKTTETAAFGYLIEVVQEGSHA